MRALRTLPAERFVLDGELAVLGPAGGFDFDALLARIEEHGDLFAPVLELEQTLPG